MIDFQVLGSGVLMLIGLGTIAYLLLRICIIIFGKKRLGIKEGVEK